MSAASIPPDGSGPEAAAAERSRVMSRVRSRNTGPERRVRRILTDMGVRYRLQRKDLPGTPDLVLAGRRLTIFVHGCFWHGHDCRRGAREPKTNRLYWRGKIERNRRRDADAVEALEALGWRILVIWECELRMSGDLVDRVATIIRDTPIRGSDPGRAKAALAPRGVV